MNTPNKTHGKGVYKRLLSLLLVLSVFITSSNLESVTAKAAEAVANSTQIYLIDNTEEKWLGNDNATLELVDNSNGHDHYEMTQMNDLMWQVSVPSTANNITFNRLNSDKTITWNSFSAGGRGTNNVYYADGSEYGHWEYICITEGKFSEGDVVYLNISNFESWGNDDAKYYINFSEESINANSQISINSSTSNNGYDIKTLEKVNEDIYRYVCTAEDEGKTELRFWRGNDTELWNCSTVLTYGEYAQGYNCIIISGWNESGESGYYDDYTEIHQRLAISSCEDDDGILSIVWSDDENIASYDIYARYNETGFEKIVTTTATSFIVDKTLIEEFVDYYVIATATDGETIESNIVTIVKNEEGICYEDVIDIDEDGIPDGYEYILGTDANVADTDKDGFSDGYEAFILCTNPLVAEENTDFDNDGLTNLEELELGTNPHIADSDFDGINDSKDTEPMKTNVNTGMEVVYEIPVKTGEFDLVSKYYDEDGNKCQLVYNYLNGQIKYMTDSHNESYNIYNDENQLTAAIEYVDGEIIANTYSYVGDDVETITHNGFQYGFQYDEDGNMTLVKVGDRTLITNQYEEGQLASEVYGNGYTNEYIYDENGNIIQKKVNGNIVYEWKYDENGNPIEYKDLVRNEVFAYTYDEHGTLIDISSDAGFKISYKEDENTYSITYECGEVIKSQTTTELEETDEDGNTKITTTTNLISGGKLVSVVSGEEALQRTVYENDTELLSSRYTYSDEGVTKIEYQDGKSLEYTYDNAGNILTVTENGELQLSYQYDSLGQLTRENNVYAGKTYTFDYDNAGNILFSKEYAYTTGELGECLSSNAYEYNDEEWRDLLTGFNGQSITYDEIGNPLNYRDNMSFTWNGRQLSVVKHGDNEVLYTYNSEGIRTSKTVNGVTTNYQLDGAKIVSETTSDTTIWYIYDENDMVIGFEYLDKAYYFEKNAQGDVLRIFDENGATVSEYVYDAWGNIVDIKGDEELAKINPFRYRGYYQDNETGFYYLQSRYYDSETGRFLNADDVDYTALCESVLEYNLYTYCINNPVNGIDEDGHAAINVICAAIGGLIGWAFGDYVAKALGYKSGWKYWAIRAGVAIGGAVIGWFAGALISKVISKYLISKPDLVMKLASKWGGSKFYSYMSFLGINPITLMTNSGKFIGLLQNLNSKTAVYSLKWAEAICAQAKKFGMYVGMDTPHKGYSYHLHVYTSSGHKIQKAHIQIAKSVYDYLKKILK